MGFLGFVDSIALMGPVKGYKKRRKVEPNVSASGSSEEGSLDWWDALSKRIAGISSFHSCIIYTCFLLLCVLKNSNYLCSTVY